MTLYRLAETGRDYAKCHELMRAEGVQQAELAYPTMMAWKDKELTAFLSTYIDKGWITAGPLVLKSGPPRYWTLIRLIEAYENVMRASGVTSFLFSVPDSYEKYLKQIDALGMKPYAKQDGRSFFVRNLDGHERRSTEAERGRERA